MPGGSYKTVNYSIRPAKSIERKMICEGLQKLVFFARLREFRYVGLGSTFYTDFVLLHKRLGIRDMIDIEWAGEDRHRFVFNRPYRCIRIKFGHSNEILPLLEYKQRTIFWMDYDGKLNGNVLADIRTVCSRAASGSVLIVTVNAEPYKKPRNVKKGFLDYSLEQMQKNVGKAFPRWVEKPSGQNAEMKGSDLRNWGIATVYSRTMGGEVERCLKDKNSGVESALKMNALQLFHFRYRDSARMLTMGWVLFEERDSDKVAKCRFDELEFVVRNGGKPVEIEVPSLTLKEIRHLNAQLPARGLATVNAPGVAPEDVAKYAALYRWFPTFAEAEL